MLAEKKRKQLKEEERDRGRINKGTRMWMNLKSKILETPEKLLREKKSRSKASNFPTLSGPSAGEN